MKSTLAAAVLVMMLAASASPACAHGRRPPAGDVSVEVVPDRGGAFLSIPHADFWTGVTRVTKRYLEARRGETYGILVRNNTPERVGMVIAVDGRNIITGKRSDLKSTEQMYIVNAHESVRLDGWRTSRSEVHRFYFTEPGDSYTVRSFSDTSALGVIAVAVYREKERPQPALEPQQRLEDAPAAAPQAGSMEQSRRQKAKDERAGTGFGDAQYAPVITVEFEPEQIAVRKTLVKYEWREELCRKGIIRCGQEPGNRLWDGEGYAPYPPGYPRS